MRVQVQFTFVCLPVIGHLNIRRVTIPIHVFDDDHHHYEEVEE